MAPLLALAVFLLAAAMVAFGAGVREYAGTRAIARRFDGMFPPYREGRSAAIIAARWLSWLGRKVLRTASRKDLQARLQRAGFSSAAAPFIFAGLRLSGAVVAFAAALSAACINNQAAGPMHALVAAFFGLLVYRGFDAALKIRIEARARAVRRELPYVLDLVLMVLDSGVNIDQALHHVTGQIEHAAPVIAVQMNRYLEEIDDGLPYDQALDRLAQRFAIAEGRDFAGLLKMNLFQGGELGPPLRRLRADIDDGRLAAAREQVGRKSVLLTIVMLAFFMPVLMIALAGPAVSDVMGTLRHVAHDLENSRTR
jgi:tight adherence protein C